MNVFGKVNTTNAKMKSKKESLKNQVKKLNKYLVKNLGSIRHDFNEKIKKLEEDSVKCLNDSEFDVLHKNLDEFKKVNENISFLIESEINHDEMISKLKDKLSDNIDKTVKLRNEFLETLKNHEKMYENKKKDKENVENLIADVENRFKLIRETFDISELKKQSNNIETKVEAKPDFSDIKGEFTKLFSIHLLNITAKIDEIENKFQENIDEITKNHVNLDNYVTKEAYISNFNSFLSLKTNEVRQEIFNIIKTMQKSIDEIFNTLQIVNKNNKIFLDFKNELNENFNIERFDDKIKLNLSSLKKDFDEKLNQIEKSQTGINLIIKTLEEKEDSLNIDDVKKNLDKELFSIKMEVIEMKNYLKIFNRDDFVAKLKHFHDHYDDLKKTLENHQVRLFAVRSDLSIMMRTLKIS